MEKIVYHSINIIHFSRKYLLTFQADKQDLDSVNQKKMTCLKDEVGVEDDSIKIEDKKILTTINATQDNEFHIFLKTHRCKCSFVAIVLTVEVSKDYTSRFVQFMLDEIKDKIKVDTIINPNEKEQADKVLLQTNMEFIAQVHSLITKFAINQELGYSRECKIDHIL